MSSFVRRRRQIQQLGQQSRLIASDSVQPTRSVAEDVLPWHAYDFAEDELTEFLNMNAYGNMAVGLDRQKIASQVDELRKQFDKEYSARFFTDARNQLVHTIANRFMIGGIVAAGDRNGGNVDTVHNVRQLDKDGNPIVATDKFKAKYDNRGDYNSNEYHSDSDYINVNRNYSEQLRNGTLADTYTGKKLSAKDGYDLDHVIAAKRIHDDPGRVLAGKDGADLANRESNLKATHASINRSKKADSVPEFLDKLQAQSAERQLRIRELERKAGLSDQERRELNKLQQLDSVDGRKMRELDRQARQEYNAEINKSYYLSKEFARDVGVTSLKEGGKMGLQQVVGVFLTELITSIFDEIRDFVKTRKQKVNSMWSELKERLGRVAERVAAKWKHAMSEGMSGFFTGICSNIVTVLINVFVTTAKNVVRLIREGFFSIVKAVKLLLNPPEGMSRAAVFHEAGKIIIGGVVVTLGILLEEAVGALPPMAMIKSIPVIGDLVYSTVFGFMVALVTSLALWGWDKMDLFGVKESARHEFVMEQLMQDRERIAERREQWLLEIRETDPERYLLLAAEVRFA
jgi:hypothetical protein